MHRSTRGKTLGAVEADRNANGPRGYYQNRTGAGGARIGSQSAWCLFLICCTVLVPTESCTRPLMGGKGVHPEDRPPPNEIGTRGSGEWFFACFLPCFGPENEKAVAGIVGQRLGTLFPRVFVAVWKDGRIVWSHTPGGGPPYYASKIAPAKLEDLLATWESAGALDSVIAAGDIPYHMAMMNIIVADGRRRLALETLQLFGKVATGPTPHPGAVRFDEEWARTRDGLLSLIPKEGGQPADLTFEIMACVERVAPETMRRLREEDAAYAASLEVDDFSTDAAVADDLNDPPHDRDRFLPQPPDPSERMD